MWCLLAMIPGVTTAQDCSTSVSADVATPCHDAWCDNCSRLLNWYDNDNCLRLLNWCDNRLRLLNWCGCLLSMVPGVKTAQNYSTGVSADVASACHNAWCVIRSGLLN